MVVEGSYKLFVSCQFGLLMDSVCEMMDKCLLINQKY